MTNTACLTRDNLLSAIQNHLSSGGRVVVGNRFYDSRHIDWFRVSKIATDSGLWIKSGKRFVYAFPMHFVFVD